MTTKTEYAKLKADPEKYAARLAYQRKYLANHPEYGRAWRSKNQQWLNKKYRLEKRKMVKNGLCSSCYHAPLAPSSKWRCQECLKKNLLAWRRRRDRARH